MSVVEATTLPCFHRRPSSHSSPRYVPFASLFCTLSVSIIQFRLQSLLHFPVNLQVRPHTLGKRRRRKYFQMLVLVAPLARYLRVRRRVHNVKLTRHVHLLDEPSCIPVHDIMSGNGRVFLPHLSIVGHNVGIGGDNERGLHGREVIWGVRPPGRVHGGGKRFELGVYPEEILVLPLMSEL